MKVPVSLLTDEAWVTIGLAGASVRWGVAQLFLGVLG